MVAFLGVLIREVTLILGGTDKSDRREGVPVTRGVARADQNRTALTGSGLNVSP